jgi:hypothetical protein
MVTFSLDLLYTQSINYLRFETVILKNEWDTYEDFLADLKKTVKFIFVEYQNAPYLILSTKFVRKQIKKNSILKKFHISKVIIPAKYSNLNNDLRVMV